MSHKNIDKRKKRKKERRKRLYSKFLKKDDTSRSIEEVCCILFEKEKEIFKMKKELKELGKVKDVASNIEIKINEEVKVEVKEEKSTSLLQRFKERWM